MSQKTDFSFKQQKAAYKPVLMMKCFVSQHSSRPVADILLCFKILPLHLTLSDFVWEPEGCSDPEEDAEVSGGKSVWLCRWAAAVWILKAWKDWKNK